MKEQILLLLNSTTSNYSFFSNLTEHFKRSFFPSTTKLWNDISLDIHCLKSIGSFKQALFSFFNVPSYNILYKFAIDRVNVIRYTRLCLDACSVNYCLFQIRCKIRCRESPACFCGFHTETVEHFLLTVLFILPLEQNCSPLLLAYLPTGGQLCQYHK